MQTNTHLGRRRFIKLAAMAASAPLVPSQVKATMAAASFVPIHEPVLTIAHMTDIHVEPTTVAEHGFLSALEALEHLPKRPDLIINGGDAIMNAATLSKAGVKRQWDSFHRVLVQSPIPAIHCIGNHDLFGWAVPGASHAYGKTWAMNEYKLTSPYYTVVRNGWKFIVLDSIHSRNSIPGYYAKLDMVQKEWLTQEITNTPMDQFICIVSHIPILAVCTLFDRGGRHKGSWQVADNSQHEDADWLRDLFYASGKVKACLSGHIHLIDHVNYLGTDYYCNGAVSGAWWHGQHQQFPPAFALMHFYSDGSSKRDIIRYAWGNT